LLFIQSAYKQIHLLVPFLIGMWRFLLAIGTLTTIHFYSGHDLFSLEMFSVDSLFYLLLSPPTILEVIF
jgi:hypothetical protein